MNGLPLVPRETALFPLGPKKLSDITPSFPMPEREPDRNTAPCSDLALVPMLLCRTDVGTSTPLSPQALTHASSSHNLCSPPLLLSSVRHDDPDQSLPWWKASSMLFIPTLTWTFKWTTGMTLDRCWDLRTPARHWNQMMICLLRTTRKISNWRPWLGALPPKTNPDLKKEDPLPLANSFLCFLLYYCVL